MRRLLSALLAASVGLCAGCVKMHMDTTIEKDGTGSCTITYSASREVVDALGTLDSSGAGPEHGASPVLPQSMSRAHVEELCRKTGVVLLDHRLAEDTDTVGWTIRLGFDDIAALSSFLNVMSSGAGFEAMESLGIFDAGEGILVLKPVAAERFAPDSFDEDDDADDSFDDFFDDLSATQDDLRAMSVLMEHIRELDIRLGFTVPGDVVHSNAMEVEGRTSIWSFNASNMMLLDEFDLQPLIRFEGQGLLIEPRQP